MKANTVRRDERLGLVDEEPQAQVVAHERRHVRAQPLARAQPPEHRARQLRPAGIVSDEGHTSVLGADRTREGLGRVVQQRAPAQRLSAGQLVRERLGEQSLHGGTALADARLQLAHPVPRTGGQLDRPVEHLERVSVHVEVVEAVLLDPAQRLQLRAAPPRSPQARPSSPDPGGPAARRRSAAAP